MTSSLSSTICLIPCECSIARPQSLVAECNLPSFCVKLSERIFSQCFTRFSKFQNTERFIMDTAESTKFSSSSEADTLHVSPNLEKVCPLLQCRGCFINRIGQDLMVIHVFYPASHPHRSAVCNNDDPYGWILNSFRTVSFQIWAHNQIDSTSDCRFWL